MFYMMYVNFGVAAAQYGIHFYVHIIYLEYHSSHFKDMPKACKHTVEQVNTEYRQK